MNIIEIKRPQELARLRRTSLKAQGLLQARPYGNGLSGACKAIHHLGYVQIDTISVVERAHHHVLHARVPGFSPDMSNQMLRQGDIFEYWAHAAAFLPMADFRFSLPYKQAIKSGQVHWFREPDRKLMAEVIARIRSDGPLRSRDLEPGLAKRAGWWDWKPAKKALEQLYMQGDLMVCDRQGFQKSYDLCERVLPAAVNTQMPSIDEFAVHLLEQQLRCHGVVSLKGLTYLRRNAGLRAAMKALVTQAVAEGRLQSLRLPDGDSYLIQAGALDEPLPRLASRVAILSPFDNCVIQRDRLRALFQFDYQIECYLPAAKRQYGYFCLPLLFRDQFVGRMDCKAHRKTGELEIKALHLEQARMDVDEFIVALVTSLQRFCGLQGCERIRVSQTRPGALAAPLRQALAAVDRLSA